MLYKRPKGCSGQTLGLTRSLAKISVASRRDTPLAGVPLEGSTGLNIIFGRRLAIVGIEPQFVLGIPLNSIGIGYLIITKIQIIMHNQ
jgi:hypothetical protein